MVNVKFINNERFGRWKTVFNRKEATPVVIIGIGHNKNEGEVVILTTEDRSDEQLRLLLAEALRQLTTSMQ